MFLNSFYALIESQILYKTERSNLNQITCFYLIPILFIRMLSLTKVVVEPNGVEPLTSCVQGRRSTN